MTNAEAIKIFKEVREEVIAKETELSRQVFENIGIKAIDFAIKVLEQQPSEDCISRQAVKEMLREEWTKYIPMELDINLSFVLEKINELPSVTPQQTRWIPVSEKPQKGRYLCTYEHCDGKCIDFGSFDGESWYIKPIAYMPLPEPYRESEDKI